MKNKQNKIEELKKEIREGVVKNMAKNTKPPKHLGTANIAGMTWCEQKFLFKSNSNKEGFKSAYEADCETLGKNLTIKQLNKILNKREPCSPYNALFNVYGEKFHDISETYPNATLEELADKLKTICKSKPKEIGKVDQQVYGRNLSTMRYHFKYKDYIIEAVPDGITDDYCYEFKSTGNKFLFYYIKRPAIYQARLYSYFFERKNYIVEVYIRKEDKKETIKNKLNIEKAKAILSRMDKLLRGVTKPRPPKSFKCKSCEWSKECSMNQK